MAVLFSHYLMPQKTNTFAAAVLQGTSIFKAGQSTFRNDRYGYSRVQTSRLQHNVVM